MQPKPPVPNAGKSVRNSRTSPEAIRHADKIAMALEYRRQNYSYSRMAEAMGHTPSYCAKLVTQGIMTIIGEPARYVIVLECERLDELQTGYYQAAIGGDLSAVNAVLKIMERRVKLLNLDGQGASLVPGYAELAGFKMAIRFVKPDGEEYTPGMFNVPEVAS